MKLHQCTLTLTAIAPFDFARTLDYLRWFRPLAQEQSVGDASFRKAFWAGGQAVLCEVSNPADITAPGVAVTLGSWNPLADAAVDAVARNLTRFLGLADDLTEFYALAEADEIFRPVLASLHGYHQVKFPSPFEAAV